MPPAPSFDSRAALEAHQLARLRELVAVVVPGNRFYSAKFHAAGVAGFDSLEQFAERLPFTTRQELNDDQLAHPPFGSNLTYALDRYTRISTTSGTSRVPIRWLDTPESWSWMIGNWLRVYEAAGVTAADRVFVAFSFGPFLGFWVAFEAGVELGCLCIPGGGLRSAARLAAMIDTGATVLCCTPTYALRLAEVAAEENIDLAASRVRTLIVGGEPGGGIPATRARIEKLWGGVRLVDHHGMTEIGPVSYECPKRRGVLHVIESSYFAEVIDAQSLKPVPPGTTGELVLTNLGRLGSPLLRYRTGDIVRPDAAGRCQCGSFDLAHPGGILGRTDDMVVIRGVKVYPSAVEDIVRGCDGVAEYRVEVFSNGALRELSLLVEPTPEQDPAELVRKVRSALDAALGLRVDVSSVAPGELPRFELKAQRWIRTAKTAP